MTIIKCENCDKWVHYNGSSNHKCDNCVKYNLYNGSMIIYDLYKKQQEQIDNLNKILSEFMRETQEHNHKKNGEIYKLKGVVKELNDKEIITEMKWTDIY